MSIAPWLTREEFCAAEGMSRRAFFYKKQAFKTVLEMAPGGKSRLMISAESLSSDARAKLENRNEPRKELTRTTETGSPALPLFSSHAASALVPAQSRRIALSPEQTRQAQQRLHILQPLLEFTEKPETRAKYSALQLADGGRVTTARDLAKYLVQTHSTADEPLSEATLWRWKGKYLDKKNGGLQALVRKVREDKGRSKWVEQFPKAAQLVRVAFRQPFATRQLAYETLVRDHAYVGMKQADLPSYDSVVSYLNGLPVATTVLARDGEAAYHDKMTGHLTRAYTDMHANDYWVADTMLHDVMVYNDVFNEGKGEAIRVQCVAIMDMRSRKFVGATWMRNGSSRGITSAFVQAVKKYGPPRAFYCDNGADFKKFAKGALAPNGELARPLKFKRPDNALALVAEDVRAMEQAGALRLMNVPVTFCKPFSPWSKPIERAFRTLHIQLDSVQRHYTTGNAYLKPDATVNAATQHGKLLQMGRAQDSPLMPASLFIRMAQDWIELDYNAKHTHNGRGMDGRTPNEVFAATLPAGGFRSYEPSILDTLLWGRKKVTVRRTEIVLNNRPMVGATPYDSAVLHEYNAREVVVCFDEHAPETAVVADENGHKLCDLRAKEFVQQGAAANPMIAESAQLHRTLRNAAAAVIREDRKAVAQNGHKSAAELMVERAMLPTSVEPRAQNPAIVQPAISKATGTFGAPMLHTEDLVEAFLAGGN